MRLNPFYRVAEGERLRRGVGYRNLTTRGRVWIAVFVGVPGRFMVRALFIRYRGADVPHGPRVALSVSCPWGDR